MWKPQPEELVPFESSADKRYLSQIEALRRALRGDKKAPLAAPSGYATWPHLVGEFPLIVVREHYRMQGYTVRFCEPARRDNWRMLPRTRHTSVSRKLDMLLDLRALCQPFDHPLLATASVLRCARFISRPPVSA